MRRVSAVMEDLVGNNLKKSEQQQMFHQQYVNANMAAAGYKDGLADSGRMSNLSLGLTEYSQNFPKAHNFGQ